MPPTSSLESPATRIALPPRQILRDSDSGRRYHVRCRVAGNRLGAIATTSGGAGKQRNRPNGRYDETRGRQTEVKIGTAFARGNIWKGISGRKWDTKFNILIPQYSSFQGTFLNDEEEDVLVKTVVAGSSEAQSHIMISEGTSLHSLMQQHIQTILAATWDGTSPMLVYPYSKHGNLKRWLLTSGQAGVSTHVVVSLGLQMLKVVN